LRGKTWRATGGVVLVLLGTLVWLAGASTAQGSECVAHLSTTAAGDTVRSNLWLARALFTQIAETVAKQLPPPPVAVGLEPRGTEAAEDLFGAVMAGVLQDRDYTLYLMPAVVRARDVRQQGQTENTAAPATAAGAAAAAAAGQEPPSGEDGGLSEAGQTASPPDANQDEGAPNEPAEQAGESADRWATPLGSDREGSATPDTTAPPPSLAPDLPRPPQNVDLVISYDVENIDLAYPRTGRRFGLWRQWIERQMSASAFVTVVERGSGRLILQDRFERAYRDRVPDDVCDDIGSSLYPWTDAERQESGLRRRLEEVVVLGTLAGLVAVYFANTGS
jgi:hypothetical protein